MVGEIVSVAKLCRVNFHFKIFKMNVEFIENSFPICIFSQSRYPCKCFKKKHRGENNARINC